MSQLVFANAEDVIKHFNPEIRSTGNAFAFLAFGYLTNVFCLLTIRVKTLEWARSSIMQKDNTIEIIYSISSNQQLPLVKDLC